MSPPAGKKVKRNDDDPDDELTKFQQELAKINRENNEKSVLAVLRSDDFPPVKAVQCTELSYARLYTEHVPASMTHKEFALCRVSQFAVQAPDLQLGFCNLTSTLLSIMEEVPSHKQLQCDTESDLRYIVDGAISDTIKICNTMIRWKAKGQDEAPFYLQRRSASTLFSNIIDHIVVYDYNTNTPIVAVETKMHLPESFAAASEQRLLGHCLDQLRELRFMGHICPFGALTSFNDTVITWLDSDVHTEVLQHHRENGFLDRPFFRDGIEDSRTNCQVGTQSPPNLLRNTEVQSQANKVIRDLHSTSGDTTAEKRSIVLTTKRFKQDELVDALVNAIFCALDGFCHRPSSTIDLVVDTCVTFLDAIGLTPTNYEWQHVSKVYKGHLTHEMYHQESTQEKLYLVSYLGMGATSKVYRAISESGYGCVVKLYVPFRDDGNEVMSDEEFELFSTNLAITEEANFKEIYPEISNYVWRDQLNKLQCLIMPFFAPIQTEERTCEAVTNGIREQLQRFGQKRKRFRRCDQLWRHVGYLDPTQKLPNHKHGTNIYLFDLGDLVDVVDQPASNEDGEPSFISDHLSRLARNA